MTRGERLTLVLLLGFALAIAYALLADREDRALSQRMRDVDADDVAVGAGHIGDDDVDLKDVIARRRRR